MPSLALKLLLHIPPKAKANFALKRRRTLIKLENLLPKLNRTQNLLHKLAGLKGLPPRQVRRGRMNLVAFVGKKGIQNPGVTRSFKH